MRPLIGITANYTDNGGPFRELGIGAPGQRWDLLPEDYIRAVERAGGLPVILPLTDPETALELAGRMDGIVFSGGSDLDPSLYGESPIEGANPPQAARDAHELPLLRAVLKGAQPLLCVCRGCQLLNAALGGTLYQDLEKAGLPPHSAAGRPLGQAAHRARVLPGTLLEQLVGATEIPVNSFHHQAVKSPAPGVRIAAVDTDCEKVVEAIELPSRPAFTLGVQWHPEALVGSEPSSLAIWQGFLRAAGR